MVQEVALRWSGTVAHVVVVWCLPAPNTPEVIQSDSGQYDSGQKNLLQKYGKVSNS